MPQWQGSDRRARLPDDWPRIRFRVGERDGWRCQADTPAGKCLRQANQCDHIERGDDHSEGNLQMLCEEHHATKSSSEGGRARSAARARMKKRWERPAEKNPTGQVREKPRFPGF